MNKQIDAVGRFVETIANADAISNGLKTSNRWDAWGMEQRIKREIQPIIDIEDDIRK